VCTRLGGMETVSTRNPFPTAGGLNTANSGKVKAAFRGPIF